MFAWSSIHTPSNERARAMHTSGASATSFVTAGLQLREERQSRIIES